MGSAYWRPDSCPTPFVWSNHGVGERISAANRGVGPALPMGAVGVGEGPATSRTLLWRDHQLDPGQEIHAGRVVPGREVERGSTKRFGSGRVQGRDPAGHEPEASGRGRADPQASQ